MHLNKWNLVLNKEKESTEEPNKENETENIENNAMDVTETEPNKDNEIVDIQNNAMDVTEEPNKENETVWTLKTIQWM